MGFLLVYRVSMTFLKLHRRGAHVVTAIQRAVASSERLIVALNHHRRRPVRNHSPSAAPIHAHTTRLAMHVALNTVQIRAARVATSRPLM